MMVVLAAAVSVCVCMLLGQGCGPRLALRQHRILYATEYLILRWQETQ